MSSAVELRLRALNIMLPEAPAPAANYVPYQTAGDLVFVSGQLPMRDGAVAVKGRLGADVSLEQGVEAARLCMINILAQAKAACGGDLDRVTRVVKLTGFVNSTGDFTDQPKVVNGASDLMVEVFGDKGKHSRAAVSAASLPAGVAVEVEAVVEIS